MRRLDTCVLPASELSVAGQLDALLAEDAGTRSLLLVETADASEFQCWARERASACGDEIAFLDFDCAERLGAVVATLGPARIRTGPPNEALRRLVASRRVLLMSGMEPALARQPRTITRWLEWSVRKLPRSLLCVRDAAPFLQTLRHASLAVGVERLIDARHARSAALLAAAALAALMEAS